MNRSFGLGVSLSDSLGILFMELLDALVYSIDLVDQNEFSISVNDSLASSSFVLWDTIYVTTVTPPTSKLATRTS